MVFNTKNFTYFKCLKCPNTFWGHCVYMCEKHISVNTQCICTELPADTWNWGHFLCCTGLSPNTHNDWMLDKKGEREKESKRKRRSRYSHTSLSAQAVLGIELQMQTVEQRITSVHNYLFNTNTQPFIKRYNTVSAFLMFSLVPVTQGNLTLFEGLHQTLCLLLWTLTLHIGPLLWVFSNPQGCWLLLLRTSQQITHTLIIDL